MAVSSDSVRLATVEEVTHGTTPATPTLNIMRITGESITFDVTTTQSDEMGGINRGVKDNILTGAAVSGSIEFELSKFEGLERAMAAALGSSWASDDLGVPGAGGNLKTYNAYEYRTFTLEKRFLLDDGPTYNYHVFVGCMFDTFSLSITPNEPITGSMGVIGNSMATSDTPLGADPVLNYTLPGTSPIMTSPLVTGIELLTPAGIDDTTGVPLGTAVPWLSNSCFTGLDLNFLNNSRGLQCIGTLGNKETSLGRFEATATGTLYYAADEPLDALITQDEFAMSVTCTDDDGESFEFFFPRVAFASASALATGTNTDVMTEFGLTLLEYQGDDYAYTVMITRSSGA